MFIASFVIDPANHKPRSGKSAMMNQMMAEMVGKANMDETIIGNGTTTIPLKFDFGDATQTTPMMIGKKVTPCSHPGAVGDLCERGTL